MVCQVQAMRVAMESMQWFLMACSLLVNYDDLCYTSDLCRGCSDVDVPVTYIRSTHRSIGSTRESYNSHKVTISLYCVSIRTNPKWTWMFCHCFDDEVLLPITSMSIKWSCNRFLIANSADVWSLNTRFHFQFFEGFRGRSIHGWHVFSLHNCFGSLPGHQDHVWTLRRIISKLGNEIILRA